MLVQFNKLLNMFLNKFYKDIDYDEVFENFTAWFLSHGITVLLAPLIILDIYFSSHFVMLLVHCILLYIISHYFDIVKEILIDYLKVYSPYYFLTYFFILIYILGLFLHI